MERERERDVPRGRFGEALGCLCTEPPLKVPGLLANDVSLNRVTVTRFEAPANECFGVCV
jgi:hypothetical protein